MEYEEWVEHVCPSAIQASVPRQRARAVVFALILSGLVLLLVYASLLLVSR